MEVEPTESCLSTHSDITKEKTLKLISSIEKAAETLQSILSIEETRGPLSQTNSRPTGWYLPWYQGCLQPALTSQAEALITDEGTADHRGITPLCHQRCF